MASPARRVLSTKDANAPLNVRTSIKHDENNNKGRGPSSAESLKHSHPNSPFCSPTAGQKRKINLVEDAERLEDEQPETFSQRTDLLSESSAEPDDIESSVRSTNGPFSNVYTSATSFAASQTNEQHQEQQFELQQEEMSQRTLDKMHAVPMPQNSSQLPPLRPTLLAEASAGSVALSSFLDFEAHDSSQNSGEPEDSGAAQPGHPTGTESETNAEMDAETERKSLMNVKAAELRTRLQLAMYKVQTNQTARPFSRLRKPESRRQSASPPPSHIPQATPRLSSSSTLKPPSSTTSTTIPRLDAAEDAISSRRAQCTAQILPAIRNLNALPHPQIDPTAYSARWVPVEDNNSDNHLPSSPPLSRTSSASSSKIDPALTELESQIQKSPTAHQLPTQLSSPPVSPDNSRSSRHPRPEDEAEDADLGRVNLKTPAAKSIQAGPTSSTVKGEAANVLLQLTRGGNETSNK